MRAGLGNHGPAVGVADEDRRTLLQVERVRGGLDVAFERQRLVLHDAHIEALCRQQVVDALPAGFVHEPTPVSVVRAGTIRMMDIIYIQVDVPHPQCQDGLAPVGTCRPANSQDQDDPCQPVSQNATNKGRNNKLRGQLASR